MQIQNFSKKIAKIHQKRLHFENTRHIFNEGFICEYPTDGLTQIINLIYERQGDIWQFIDSYENTFSTVQIFLHKTQNEIYYGKNQNNSETWNVKSNFLHQTFIEVREKKLFIWHNKASNIGLSEQIIPHSTNSFEQLIVAAIKLMVFTTFCISHFQEIFVFCIFAKKFAKCDRKFSHFFAKHFFRWKPSENQTISILGIVFINFNTFIFSLINSKHDSNLYILFKNNFFSYTFNDLRWFCCLKKRNC